MKPLLDETDRQIIGSFYKNQKQYKPLVVTRFEMAQAKRNFARGIEHYLKPIVEFLNRKL